MAEQKDMARLSREQELHEAEQLHEEYGDRWEESDLLSTKNIPAREGFVQRWVRTTVKGNDDQSNVFRKLNKGWRPRMRDTIPKGQFVMSIQFQGSEVIGIHGMLLMERPVNMQVRERMANMQKTDMQLEAVKQNMFRVHEPGKGLTSPKMNIESSVSRGRKAIVDD